MAYDYDCTTMDDPAAVPPAAAASGAAAIPPVVAASGAAAAPPAAVWVRGGGRGDGRDGGHGCGGFTLMLTQL
jgi:hypothetical protein